MKATWLTTAILAASLWGTLALADTGRGTLSIPEDAWKVLSAPPAHGPRMPREVIDACARLRAGDACSFSHDGETVSGTCREGPPGAPLGCAPAMGPPPPRAPQAALDACARSRPGEACSFSHDGHAISGMCHPSPEGALDCRPGPGKGGPGGHHGNAGPCQIPRQNGASATLTLDGQTAQNVQVFLAPPRGNDPPPVVVVLSDGRRLLPVPKSPPPHGAPAIVATVSLSIVRAGQTLVTADYSIVECGSP